MRDKVRTDINVLGTRLKGHAVVDLHDTVKGTYKRVEADNLVTDAYKYHMANSILNAVSDKRMYTVGTGVFGVLPLADSALGGLMIFDGELREDAKNVHFPGDVHLVGYADRGGDTMNAMRGTYNNLESGRTDTGHKSVWDFTTSQCNSVIRSLSLTHIMAGGDPVGNFCVAGGWSPGLTPAYIYHDGEKAWGLGDNLTVTEYSVPQTVIGVGQGGYAYTPGETFTPEGYADDALKITSKDRYLYNGNGYIYGAELKADNPDPEGAVTLRYCRVDVSEWKYDAVKEVSISGVTGRSSDRVSVSGHYAFIAGYDMTGYNRGKIFIVDLENTADVRVAEGSFYVRPAFAEDIRHKLAPLGGGAVVNCTGDDHDCVIYADGAVVVGSGYRNLLNYSGMNLGSIAGWSDTLLTRWYSYYNYGTQYQEVVSLPYLGTICNLDNAVTKTAASTMKITYTLDDA